MKLLLWVVTPLLLADWGVKLKMEQCGWNLESWSGDWQSWEMSQSKSFKPSFPKKWCWTCSRAESLVWKSALKAQLTWIGKNISPSAPPASQYILIIITEAPVVIYGFNILLLMVHRRHPPTDTYCPIVGRIYPLPLYIFNLHIFYLAKIFLCEFIFLAWQISFSRLIILGLKCSNIQQNILIWINIHQSLPILPYISFFHRPWYWYW